MNSPRPLALVTGASRGIGAATAVLLAKAGYDLVINYCHNQVAAETVCHQVKALGVNCSIFQADIADENAVLALFAHVDGCSGRLECLVNNAGILATQSRVMDLSAARITRVLAVNVLGTLLCSREAIKRMSSQHGGSGGVIVNVSSGASRSGSPGEYVDYAASKGAVDSLTVGMAQELAGEAIRVNAVRPGFIYTDIHASGGEPDRVNRLKSQLPMGRGGEASEVAEAIVWLASAAASYVTGSIIDVTGGR